MGFGSAELLFSTEYLNLAVLTLIFADCLDFADSLDFADFVDLATESSF